MQKLAEEIGLNFEGISAKPAGEALKLKPLRIGLWDRYGGSMPSGWTRFLLEKFEFPFTVIYPATLDAGDLASKFDVLIFATGGIPARDARERESRTHSTRHRRPKEFQQSIATGLGSVTVAKTVPQLKRFLEAGGTILSVGTSTSLAYHAGLPIVNALDGEARRRH